MSHHPEFSLRIALKGAALTNVLVRTDGSSRRPSRAGDKYIDMLLTDADRKERITRLQQSIAELSALTNDKK
jgi:hypothetical protein